MMMDHIREAREMVFFLILHKMEQRSIAEVMRVAEQIATFICNASDDDGYERRTNGVSAAVECCEKIETATLIIRDAENYVSWITE